MTKLTDGSEELECYKNALRNWRCEGYVVLLKDAENALGQHLDGITPFGFREILHQHVVVEGGRVDQIVERRPDWSKLWEFHYDVWPMIGGTEYYVESRLRYKKASDPDDPVIYIANLKPNKISLSA